MTKVIVIGAGPAGIRACEVLVDNGICPTLIDESAQGGGQCYRRPQSMTTRSAKTLYGFQEKSATKIHETIDRLKNKITWRPESTVWSASREHIHVLSNTKQYTLPWDRLIIATGAMDRVIPFAGWTLPGVYTLGGAQVALKAQACSIGEKPVFIGTGPLLYLVAYQYAMAGITVGAVLDTSTARGKLAALPGLVSGGNTFLQGLFYVAMLKRHRIPVYSGIRPVEILAGQDQAVRGIAWKNPGGREICIDCDSVALGFGLKSETQIADLCETEFEFNSLQRQWLPVEDADGRASVEGIYLAGDGAGVKGALAAEISGTRAAQAMLVDLGRSESQRTLAELNKSLKRFNRFRKALDHQAFPFPADMATSASDALVVCRCEGITAGDIRKSVNELGASEINRAKAFTRVGMGRCQGRVCAAAAAEIMAATRAVAVSHVGRLRGQSPIKPVMLSSIAEVEPQT